ncbi:MAG TPA: CotH kinase family protein [Methylomirabilota bacterium]|nr:CotH kinase family protein [Methylomirabilota bacterium]
MWKRWFILLAVAASLFSSRAAEKKKDAADALFRDPSVHTLQIEISTANLSKLTQANRDYVRATVRDGDVVLRDAGVRLKGHGTFQPVDKKPAFAIKFNEFVTGQEYRGLSKLVLNNSVSDASYIREWLAAELYREAGIPAARVTHVRVQLNGRDLGFYVLAEAMNKGFLKREFGNGGGNLYEGETKDVDQKLDQENGDDTSQNDLKRLVAAAKAPAAQRLAKLQTVLDLEQFTAFLAMEMLTAGIDGYAFNRNNYRVYHHPTTEKLIFLPHGLDATFGSASFKPPTGSLIVKALWELPDFQQQYRARLGELAEKVWRVDRLTNRVNSALARLTGAASTPAVASALEKEAKTLRYQIEQQHRFIKADLKHASRD